MAQWNLAAALVLSSVAVSPAQARQATFAAGDRVQIDVNRSSERLAPSWVSG